MLLWFIDATPSKIVLAWVHQAMYFHWKQKVIHLTILSSPVVPQVITRTCLRWRQSCQIDDLLFSAFTNLTSNVYNPQYIYIYIYIYIHIYIYIYHQYDTMTNVNVWISGDFVVVRSPESRKQRCSPGTFAIRHGLAQLTSIKIHDDLWWMEATVGRGLSRHKPGNSNHHSQASLHRGSSQWDKFGIHALYIGLGFCLPGNGQVSVKREIVQATSNSGHCLGSNIKASSTIEHVFWSSLAGWSGEPTSCFVLLFSVLSSFVFFPCNSHDPLMKV